MNNGFVFLSVIWCSYQSMPSQYVFAPWTQNILLWYKFYLLLGKDHQAVAAKNFSKLEKPTSAFNVFCHNINITSLYFFALWSFHINASLTIYFALQPWTSTLFILQFILHLSSFCTSPNFAWVYSSWNCLSINDWDPHGRVVLTEAKSTSHS